MFPTRAGRATASFAVMTGAASAVESPSGEHRLVGAGPLIESSTLVLDQRE